MIFLDAHLFLDLSLSALCGYFLKRLFCVPLCSLKKEALDELKFNEMWAQIILICFPVKLWRLGCYVETAN